ncbi:MAG: RNA 2',3'-cyclic phosphodiesterase [Clostridia bacterium]|nr:RNA 2',3'-cyclic phosphodiesterase [Clostridia bacterium]
MRLFIAIRFSREIENALMNAIEKMKSQGIGANFTRRENLHLTLAFIGESDRAEDIKNIIDSLDAHRFEMTVEGSGSFGDLYWAGIGKNPELEGLARDLCGRLRAAGFDIERRRFTPHITLARRVVGKKRPEITIARTAMTVGRISLMRSDRIDGRLCYREVYGRDI